MHSPNGMCLQKDFLVHNCQKRIFLFSQMSFGMFQLHSACMAGTF